MRAPASVSSLRLSLLTVLAAASAASSAWAQTAGTAPPPPATAQSAGAAAARAFFDANSLRDAAAKLAALEKVRTDFPTYAQTDIAILSTLAISFSDRRDAITAVLDRMLARIPADAGPDSRLTSVVSAVQMLVSQKILLERCEQLLTDALDKLTPDAYAASRRGMAQRMRTAEPTDSAIRVGFAATRARGLDVLGRTLLARGDTARGVATLTESVASNATYSGAVMTLVSIHTARNDFASAERLLQASIAATAAPPAMTPTMVGGRVVMTGGNVTVGTSSGERGAAVPMLALANLYLRRADTAKAEAMFREIVSKNPTSRGALIELARFEARRGDHRTALERYLLVATSAPLAADDDSAMRAMHRAINGPAATIDDDIDTLYREKFPNPVKPEPYTPTAARSDRVVLLEMFTGAACAPCVGADLALDAALERYPEDAVIAVTYHANIPGPDPMVVSGGDARRTYYKVRGVPTFNIDGALGQLGGGSRERASLTFANYRTKIEQALESPAKASLTVAASGSGNRISVTADVTKLPADAKDLRLHILLVERQLRYTGENGVRFHPMVVRAVAGDSGAGIPITSAGTMKHTFNLTAASEDVRATLSAELTKRRSSRPTPAGAVVRPPAIAGRAYTAIDTTQLVVVAFIQQGPYVPTSAAPAAGAGFETNDDDPPVAGAPARPATGVAGPNVLQAARANVVFRR